MMPFQSNASLLISRLQAARDPNFASACNVLVLTARGKLQLVFDCCFSNLFTAQRPNLELPNSANSLVCLMLELCGLHLLGFGHSDISQKQLTTLSALAVELIKSGRWKSNDSAVTLGLATALLSSSSVIASC